MGPVRQRHIRGTPSAGGAGEGVTLCTMQSRAGGLGCRFIYAIVAESGHVSDIMEAAGPPQSGGGGQAGPALEAQSLSDARNTAEVDRLAAYPPS